MFRTPHPTDKLKPGVVLNRTFSQRLLPLQLLPSVYQPLLHHRNPRNRLNPVVQRLHGIIRIRVNHQSIPLGDHPHEELQPRIRPSRLGAARTGTRSGIDNPMPLEMRVRRRVARNEGVLIEFSHSEGD